MKRENRQQIDFIMSPAVQTIYTRKNDQTSKESQHMLRHRKREPRKLRFTLLKPLYFKAILTFFL